MRSDFFLLNSNYDEETAEVFKPFLERLPQLTYKTMDKAFEKAQNITKDNSYVKLMSKRTLRWTTFQASFFSLR